MPAEDTPPTGSASPASPAGQDAGPAQAHPADEYDSPWKDVIEGAYPEFMAFRFPTAKLLDHEPRLAGLRQDSNPFALVTAAHLTALRTRRDVQRRFAAKRDLVKLLYGQGWTRQRVIDLFAIIDWMLALPKPLERRVWQDIEEIERKADMRYVTSVERLAIERGMATGLAQGMAQGLEKGLEKGMKRGVEKGQLKTLTRQLTRRFGELPPPILARLDAANPEQLDVWTDRVLDAPTLEAVFEGH